MLKRVKIQGYKSLVDIDVELQPLTVLFGPNASGKSNFLDALQLVSRLMTSKNLRDAFDSPYRGSILESFSFGPRGIEGLLEQERASFSIEIEIEPSLKTRKKIQDSFVYRRLSELYELGDPQVLPFDEIKSLQYMIEIEIEPKSGIPQASQQVVTIVGEKSTHELNVAAPFSSLLNRLTLAGPFYLISALFLLEEIDNWRFFYLEPRERMRQSAPVRETHHIGSMGEDIGPFLNTLRTLDEPNFKAIEKALHLLIPEITGIDLDVNKRGEVEVQLMQGETPLPASVLSEGTWRILGLLALSGAQETPALSGFEEPETGINPQRLDLIASLLTNLTYNDTQVIVTTHSPTLLDALPQESLYVVQQREGKTGITPLARFDAPSATANKRPVSERLLRGDFNVI